MIKAARLYAPRDMRIDLIPEPRPSFQEVLIRVKAVAICGSDLHTYLHGEIGGIKLGSPLVLGHEFSGIVESVGEGVTDLFPGQRVAVDPAIPCLKCEPCLRGNPNICMNIRFAGTWPDDGALREKMTYPARCCFPIPDTVSYVEGALLEPLGVALHAVDLAKIRIGDTVAVLGVGAIGLLIVRAAKLAGAGKVFATDILRNRLDFALRYGADEVFDASECDPVEEIMRATKKRGVDVAIEAAWADRTVDQAVEVAKHGGRVVIVGIPAEDEIRFRASSARRKGLTVLLSRRMKHMYPRAISLFQKGLIDLEGLATHRFPLDRTALALETAATYSDGVIRAVVEM